MCNRTFTAANLSKPYSMCITGQHADKSDNQCRKNTVQTMVIPHDCSGGMNYKQK